jgi:hypothetical protein
MNNLLTSIAFSVYSNKGIYALMLGSGISRSSGIPTGWEIVLDLIRKLAVLNNENCDTNEVNWFVQKYNEDPDYSTILSKLALQSTERVNLLKSYFEPTESERENNLKEPTIAHKAIAQLIKAGYIKVVITTNFDRLLENALREVGIEPQVIRHVDDINGAMPLVHSEFTLIKVNGDYLDSRFLNTKQELSDYHLTLKEYILRILNEYGLITCGWSAKWDTGLVNTIRQSENFRFSSFWSYVGTCEPELNDLSTYRKGNTIEIYNADSFFTELKERVEALSKMENNHPLNADIAVERLKKYIVKEENKILLYDLFYTEQESVFNRMRSIKSLNSTIADTNLQYTIQEYETILNIALPLIINATIWSKQEHEKLIIDLISRISEPKGFINGQISNPLIDELHYIPSLFLLYGVGIAAVKYEKFSLLKKIFYIKINRYDHEDSDKNYLIEKVNARMFEDEVVTTLMYQGSSYYTPLSKWLCTNIFEYFKCVIPNKIEFNEIFDIFENLLSVNYLHIVTNSLYPGWSPYGQYHWRQRRLRNSDTLFKEFYKLADKEKEKWLPIKQGMFDGSYNTYSETKKKLDEFLSNVRLG